MIKAMCGAGFVLLYLSLLPFQGPCITALAVILLPWYIFIDWGQSIKWLLFIVIAITLIESSYIWNRMRVIKEFREKEGILL